MKLLGIDTDGIKLVGRIVFTNATEFPIVVSVWQTGPLYYRVLAAGQTWSTDCGSVWFTVKAWLYNGENNINPGIKYSLLAGNIVGFAALGALGLGASALASHHGVSLRNPDWEEWLRYNGLDSSLDDKEVIRGINSIRLCEYSRAGIYAGKHPHLFVSGGPVKRCAEKGNGLRLEWHELRIDKCAFDNDATPAIRISPADMQLSHEQYHDVGPVYNDGGGVPTTDISTDSFFDDQIDLIEGDESETAPKLPDRPKGIESRERAPSMPKRPVAPRTNEADYEYKIST